MQELIKRLNNNDPELTKVNLANQNLDKELCMKICLALAKNTQVKYLDLSNNSLKEDGWLILSKMLRLNSSLIGLNLENSFQERYSYKAKTKLLEALLDSSLYLEELNLADNGEFDKDESGKLVEFLSKKPALRSLNLAGILDASKLNIADFSAAIAKNRDLITINLDRLSLHYHSYREDRDNPESPWAYRSLLMNLFAKDTPLISLRNCSLGSDGILEIAALLQECNGRNINLDLSNNYLGLGVEFGFDLALALPKINCLHSLNLDKTNFSKVNTAALQHGLEKNRSLRVLSLKENNEIDATMLLSLETILQKRLRDDFIVLLLTLNQLINDHQLNSDLWLHIIDYLNVAELNKTPEEKRACAKLILEENHTTLKTKLNQLPTDAPLVKEKATIGKKLFYFFDQEKTASLITKDSGQLTGQTLKL